MSRIEHGQEHEHHPAPGAVIDARSGQHLSRCSCGLTIVALTPGSAYGDWLPYYPETTIPVSDTGAGPRVVDPLGLERCAVCANAFSYDGDEAATYHWRRTGHVGFVCRYCADEIGRETPVDHTR